MIEDIIEMVADQLGVSPEKITADTRFDTTPMDSLEFVELMQLVADSFWTIPEAQWVSINTPADIVRELEACKVAA